MVCDMWNSVNTARLYVRRNSLLSSLLHQLGWLFRDNSDVCSSDFGEIDRHTLNSWWFNCYNDRENYSLMHTQLIATGLCIIGLAKRQNRCNYLIKISRASSLTSALVCAALTFTTATIHMTKLQALQECQYSQKTRTCMCISTHSEGLGKDVVDITGFKLVFDANADCSIVHGALYSCLRAVFGLSVFGVFLEVFICMLVHQLLRWVERELNREIFQLFH